MLRLHDNLTSGNGFKVRLFLAQLGCPTSESIRHRPPRDPHAGVPAQEPQRPHPAAGAGRRQLPGRVERDPLVPGGGNPFLPDDRRARAEVLQWMFFEQYSHEPNIATVRFWITHAVPVTPLIELSMPAKRAQGAAALGVMEGHLARRTFFAGERYTIADIALYAYTHVAGEGGFDLRRTRTCAPGWRASPRSRATCRSLAGDGGAVRLRRTAVGGRARRSAATQAARTPRSRRRRARRRSTRSAPSPRRRRPR